ncbi:MAG: dienelactone hydrolase family protein, partial [Flavobacteriales bacterium]|nr:dienelactone hydrolase family protein [Flavobacteriales bacterium]
MRHLTQLLVLALPIGMAAQPFSIGTTTVTFIDEARGGRAIPCEVAYPAVNAGTDVPVAPGMFPVVVLGHGFVMTVGAYANFREALVPEGYVLVLPTTEGGLLPNHSAFGTDLAFCASAFQAAGADDGSPFFGHIATTSALMGHSMGGGAAILGAAASSDFNAVVCFAPAETNPSAIAAAGDVDAPLLILSGSQDCVTPPNDNQLPMYQAAPAAC